ncbi:hypothetical protein FKW77_009018 [Venturia effusa]|uniref:Uncharacterized protein n=1 Tax=Venturia effusa TaxID=50376 RepID=A0A517L1X3_9PEZI|nr:hypothetical protein FKW77_009018 [Venturia effusa]
MDSVATNRDATLVTKVLVNTLESSTRATATTFTNPNEIGTSSSQPQSTLTETIVYTVSANFSTHPTSTPIRTSASSASYSTASSTASSSSQNGTIAYTPPRRFPTTLVAILLSLLSLAILAAILIYLRRHNRLHPPTFTKFTLPKKTKDAENYVWSAYGLVRQSSLEQSKKRHRLRDLQREAQLRGEAEDPVAVAIRKEEQERIKRQMEERGAGSRFYASQVKHLVQLMGSKEEVRIDVGGQLRRARSWRWGRGKGMSTEEVQKSVAGGGGIV